MTTDPEKMRGTDYSVAEIVKKKVAQAAWKDLREPTTHRAKDRSSLVLCHVQKGKDRTQRLGS